MGKLAMRDRQKQKASNGMDWITESIKIWVHLKWNVVTGRKQQVQAWR